ncbi:MAG: glycosyltransferase family 39 protein [Candidatus Methanoperedens sp.]|nr:glycosyltransferase family 39 protein [Candidatus Methanoperedens sp.]
MNYKKITQYIYNNLLLIILLIFISYWYLSNINGALSHDEVNYYNLAQSLLTGSDMYIWADHPKLGHWILTFSLLATDWSPIGARIPSFILSIFTLILIYEITKMFSNKYIGLLTVIIVSSINIFGSNAVIGILDMSFLFFVILLLYLMIKYLQQTESISKKMMLILLGAASAGISNIKYFGFFFALTAFLCIFYIETKNRTIKIKDSKLKYYFAAFIITCLLIYLPYLSFDTDNIKNRINADVANMGGNFGNEKYNLSNPMISLFVLIMPYLPSIFYLFARSFTVQIFFNTSHAPWWTYFNMIWVYGGIIYTAGLLSSIIIIIIHKYYNKKLDPSILFLSVYSIIPLLFFSLVGTKLIKYMLPFFVLFTILIIIILYNSINQLMFLNKRNKILSVILFIILLIISIIPIPQIFVMYGSSSIKADSKYDVASQELNDYINNTDKTEIFLLVDSPTILNYYIHFQNNTNFNIQYTKCATISKFINSICLEYKNKKSNRIINMYLVEYWYNTNNFEIYFLLKDDKFDRIIMANETISSLNTHTKLYNNSKLIYVYRNIYTG